VSWQVNTACTCVSGSFRVATMSAARSTTSWYDASFGSRSDGRDRIPYAVCEVLSDASDDPGSDHGDAQRPQLQAGDLRPAPPAVRVIDVDAPTSGTASPT
jgi:hypothetical protein